MKCCVNALDYILSSRFLIRLAIGQSDFVEYAVHHNWIGGGIHFPMVTWDNKDQQFIKKSSSLVFELLQPLFTRETYALPLPADFITSPAETALYGYYQPAVADTAPAALLLSAVNQGANEQVLSWPTDMQVSIDGVLYTLQPGNMASVYAAKLDASKGAPGFSTQPVTPIQEQQNSIVGTSTLPTYSVNLLRIPLKKVDQTGGKK